MKVWWTKRAERDLSDIFGFIAADNLESAIQMDRLLRSSTAILAQFPSIGVIGRVAGTREYLVRENYWLIYRIKGQSVQILRIVHAAMNYP